VISVLVPSRGRPDSFARTVVTAVENAAHPLHLEFVVRLDHDDPALPAYSQPEFAGVRYLTGERCLLSDAWNECYAAASGEIVMHCGDDITFNTPGWDGMVMAEFAVCPDKILFVHGDDLGPHGHDLGTHGFVHRRWVEEIGYFLPPIFSCDWADVWLTEVADELGRRRFLPFVTEHHHYTFGKAERDETHAEREERGERDNVKMLYQQTKGFRDRDVRKLRTMRKEE
jgi:hypothetical protein